MKKSITITQGLQSLFGTFDRNIRFLEKSFGVQIQTLDGNLEIVGDNGGVAAAEEILRGYAQLATDGIRLDNGEVESLLKIAVDDPTRSLREIASSLRTRAFGKKQVTPKSLNQRLYVEAIEGHDIVFGVGPAGTGKTYLAVALALAALQNHTVSRIVLARPAVEAGERLGFLPGTLQEKVDPYLQPLYDALYDLSERDKVDRLLEKNVIEVAPIAFMRGRTLNESFVILDEAQNTTHEQMKMFLTRIGFNSKAVITGDITQIDLPSGKRSGLVEAIDVVSNIAGIAFVWFNEKDVVRHALVQEIIKAYEAYNLSRALTGVGSHAQPGEGAHNESGEPSDHPVSPRRIHE
ncbi:MAG: PhoH family protein [Acidobacteriia bacterium]|nr:PhoH family protein [Terriglobia bacterium]